jgi:hypothetical protein
LRAGKTKGKKKKMATKLKYNVVKATQYMGLIANLILEVKP